MLTIESFRKALITAERAVDGMVSINPRIKHGAPCITGTRIPVYIILEKLEGGYSIEKILEAYPDLTTEQVTAAIRYAAEVLEIETSDPDSQS